MGHEQEEGGKWPYAGTSEAIKALGAKHCVKGVTISFWQPGAAGGWGPPLLWLGRQHLQPGPAQGTVRVESLRHRQTTSRGVPGPRGSSRGSASEEQYVPVSLQVSVLKVALSPWSVSYTVVSGVRVPSPGAEQPADLLSASGHWAGQGFGVGPGQVRARPVLSPPRVCVSWGRSWGGEVGPWWSCRWNCSAVAVACR